MLKYTFYTLLLSTLFFGCSASKQNVLSSGSKPASTSKYRSQSGYYFALVEKNNNIWKIIDIKDMPIEKRAKTNQDILRISETYSEVHPYFSKIIPANTSNRYACGASNNKNQYTPCTSNLTSYAPAQNIVDIIKNLNSNSPKDKYIDKNLIAKAVKETDLFNAIESKKNIFEYEQCERSFSQASTVDEFNTFIEKYSHLKNAEQLIALAVQNRDAMLEKIKAEDEKRRIEEEQLAKIHEQKTQIRKKQLEKETSMLEQMEQRAMHNFTKNIENFRQTLKAGAETNCGKIVEMKKSAVKVHFPLKDYGDEHWIDLDKIFPKGHGCRFVKGKYIAPATF
ncbi:MAG: hypothetical protein QG560_285 [Campylobacterota bacterium]|nr:hypothetical protein [Campylobacterota bacterium]MDQ1338104.1 hypothetical protein [Campylobacterota bacterium]